LLLLHSFTLSLTLSIIQTHTLTHTPLSHSLTRSLTCIPQIGLEVTDVATDVLTKRRELRVISVEDTHPLLTRSLTHCSALHPALINQIQPNALHWNLSINEPFPHSITHSLTYYLLAHNIQCNEFTDSQLPTPPPLPLPRPTSSTPLCPRLLPMPNSFPLSTCTHSSTTKRGKSNPRVLRNPKTIFCRWQALSDSF
jgi:hypothetical protein